MKKYSNIDELKSPYGGYYIGYSKEGTYKIFKQSKGYVAIRVSGLGPWTLQDKTLKGINDKLEK